jgi:hypothetical protein
LTAYLLVDQNRPRLAGPQRRRPDGRRHATEHKSFGSPDETREFPNGRAEILNIGGGEVGRLVFEPG